MASTRWNLCRPHDFRLGGAHRNSEGVRLFRTAYASRRGNRARNFDPHAFGGMGPKGRVSLPVYLEPKSAEHGNFRRQSAERLGAAGLDRHNPNGGEAPCRLLHLAISSEHGATIHSADRLQVPTTYCRALLPGRCFRSRSSVPLEIDDTLDPRRVVCIRRACRRRKLIALASRAACRRDQITNNAWRRQSVRISVPPHALRRVCKDVAIWHAKPIGKQITRVGERWAGICI